MFVARSEDLPPAPPSLNPRRYYSLSIKVLAVAAALSLLVHLLVIYSAYQVHPFRNMKSLETDLGGIEVALAPKALEVTDTFQETSKDKPKNPRFASSRDLSTKEETSPDRAPTNLAKIAGNNPNINQQKSEKVNEKSKSKSKDRPADNGSIFSVSTDDLLKEGKLNENKETLVAGAEGITSPGFAEKLKRGEELKVNALGLVYGQYILRMKERLMQHWRPQDTIQPAMYQNKRIMVTVAVVLNNDGEIIDIRKLDASGFASYDGEAVRSFRAAGPFPHPPRELIQQDGNVYMPWTFVLSTSGWGTY